MYYRKRTKVEDSSRKGLTPREFQPNFVAEFSEELTEKVDESDKEK
jgi:hypothetical protein